MDNPKTGKGRLRDVFGDGNVGGSGPGRARISRS